MEKSKLRYFINLTTTFLSQGFTAISLLVLTPHFFTYLGPEQYAVYGIMLQWIAAATILDFGMNTGLLRRIIAEPAQRNELINTQFFSLIAIVLLCLPTTFIFTKLSAKYQQYNIISLVLLCLLIAQNLLAVFFDVLIQSANKIFLGRTIRTVKTIVEFLCLYIIARKGEIIGLLLAAIIVNAGYLFALYYYAKKEICFSLSIKKFSWPLLKNHLHYSLWYFLAVVATIMVFNAQAILLNTMVAASVVAQYLLVNRFYEVLKIGMTNFSLVLFPSLVSIQASDDWVQLRKLFYAVLIRVLCIAIFVMVILYFFGAELFILWSKQYNPDTLKLLGYYGIFILLIAIDSVSAIFLSALKLNKVQTIVALAQGVIAIILAYLLIPKMGIAGMALASIIALLCTNFVFNPVYLLSNIKHGIQQKST